MTDIPSGLKRPYEGERDKDWKRRREDDEHRSRPRDWREVHLRTDNHRDRDTGRDRDHERRGRGGYRKGDDYYRRDGRDRDRVRDHRRPYSHGPRGQYDDRRSNPRPHHNGTPKGKESDIEEGEISPRREHSRAPSSSHLSPPRHVDQEPEELKATAGRDAAFTDLPSQPRQPDPEIDLAIPEEEPSIEAQMAARRAKRAAILAKYSAGTTLSSPDVAERSITPSASVQPLIRELTIEDHAGSRNQSPGVSQGAGTVAQNVHNPSRSPSPSVDANGTNAFSLAKEGAEGSVVQSGTTDPGEGEQVSAADYDPSLDRREDEERRVKGMVVKAEPQDNAMEVIEEVELEEEDVDDMFAIATGAPTRKNKVKVIHSAVKPLITTATLDSAADPEGYYQIILGEQLDGGRYQVFSSLGKGMFSNVVRARVLNGEGAEASREVAIKIVRAQESMHKAGLKEVQILNKLRQSDPDDKKHIVRLERTFEHRGHLCLVFENLSMNLRDVIKRFGKDVGLNIRAVRAYASQLFLALSLLRKCNIMHADIKPDNILVSENKTVLKVCDLGSASDVSENEITPYLVSRFYRAPEIILGLPYDASLDVWSIGCTLYELYTGKILFPGRSNNQMLLFMMELKGRFNSKMIKKAKFGDVYFDEMGGFQSLEKDKVTGGDVTRTVHINKPARDLRARLVPPASAKLKDDETKMVLSFVDLLDKCLVLDPTRRITPKDALMHPFVRGV